MNSTISNYIQTQILYPLLIDDMPSESLGLICVIPCHDNDQILRSIQSLKSADRPSCDVEIYVMIYACRDDEQSLHDRNMAIDVALHEIDELPDWCRMYVITNNNFAAAKANPDFVAKIGMDDAVRRFNYMKNPSGCLTVLNPDFGIADIQPNESHKTVTNYCQSSIPK